jgi:hypothetical protein
VWAMLRDETTFESRSAACHFHRDSSSPTVPLVRNDPVITACRTLIKESMGCEDDQAALQDG